ncbi:hypothetical protein LA52FAK_44810 [Desulforhopalus sp. 52FAK]
MWYAGPSLKTYNAGDRTFYDAIIFDFMLQAFGGENQLLLLTGIFIVNVFTSLFISNSPTAVLFALVNILVRESGGYKFINYIKIGIPLFFSMA